jgi:threonine synthase
VLIYKQLVLLKKEEKIVIKAPFDTTQTWLSCMKCGRKADLLKERHFVCPSCGGLFDVEHDFSAISHPVTQKLDFSDRMSTFSHKAGNWRQSGVWRYRELIMPYLPAEHIVSLGEGNVPILRAGKNLCEWVGHENLWLILEGMTPTGSFKDFGGTVLISVAKAAGIKAVVCASTGDTSAMAAAYAAAARMMCAVILPAGKVTSVQFAQPLVHGAIVITLPGNFDDCMEVARQLVTEYGAYPANSLNPARIEGHQATAFQIAHFFDWQMPEWIALPVGNGSNCSSVGKGMKLLHVLGFVPKTSHILGCQSRAACPLAKSWLRGLAQDTIDGWLAQYKKMRVGETTATAARIGNPVSAEKVMREILSSHGVMEIAEEKDLNKAVAVCGQDGIFVCPQTGIALAGIRNAVRSGRIKKNHAVVAVSTATGLKFTESAVKPLEKTIIRLDKISTKAVAKILHL